MSVLLDREQIEAILPHREPFLFVDSITEIEPGHRIVGEVRVDASNRCLGPGSEREFLPATLVVEAMAQVGAILVLHPRENRGRTIYFRAIDDAELHHPIPAGTTLKVEGVVRKLRARFGSLDVRAFLREEPTARAVMSFALS